MSMSNSLGMNCCCLWLIFSVGFLWDQACGSIFPRNLEKLVKRSQLAKNPAERCVSPNICISITSCPGVLQLLRKAVKEPHLRDQTIALVRKRLCGGKQADFVNLRGVCCPAVPVGHFSNKHHMKGLMELRFRNDELKLSTAGGELFALDNSTLVVKGLVYSGLGPDAFFLAGE